MTPVGFFLSAEVLCKKHLQALFVLGYYASDR